MIRDGEIEQAAAWLSEYEQVMPEDIDIYSMKSVIFILENRLVDAKEVLEDGLFRSPSSFDLLYNAGYVCHQLGDYKEAIRYYSLSELLASTQDQKIDLIEAIQNIKQDTAATIIEQKKKVVFFVKEGLDSFIDSIINELSFGYITKKVVVKELRQIDQEMKSADVCWFEWCDELVGYGSRLALAKEKRIICRLHSYEAFTNSIHDVDWQSVDKVIFVAEHIRQYVLENESKLDKSKTVVIPNSVNVDQYTYQDRQKGFNIAYAGYINYKKGPMLLLHMFQAIYERDRRYKLYIAGTFQDPRYILYFNQMIKEMGLEHSVIIDGWQNNLDAWLEDKHYIVSSSLLESQHLSVMEAMSKGIKPIVHNFVGAKDIYPNKYIWNTISEAVRLILSTDYNSSDYRSYVEQNYSIESSNVNIRKLLYELLYLDTEKLSHLLRSLTEFYYDERKVRFFLPSTEDFIQRSIYYLKTFYEVDMLEHIKKTDLNGKVIVDVGANIGNHTVFFSKICNASRVFSFEPQKEVFHILKTNVEINNLQEKVALFNMALGEKRGKGTIKIVDKKNTGMTKVNSCEDGEVMIDSLDNLLLPADVKIDLMKIDVEGMALGVLKGAQTIISKYKPQIYVEAETDDEFQEIGKFLRPFGYEPKWRFNATPTYLFVSK